MAQGELPIIEFPSQAAWEEWLAENWESDGLWLMLAKKGSGKTSVTYAEAVEVALAFGWIDSQLRKHDDAYYLQRFTPRRARSKWSRINREKVTALIEAGKMRPGGLAEVEKAKADGRWDAAYEPPSTALVPEDLQARLEQDPAAARSFEALNKANRYAIIFQLEDAKRAETRQRRLDKFMAMLKRGEKLY